MNKLLVLLSIFFISAGSSFAADVEFKEGVDYQLIKPAQPTDDSSRLEVLEIFWFGCPHCYHFEPTLDPWVVSLPADVNFARLPAVFNEQWERHARAYFAADILGVLDESHGALFHAMHAEKAVINTVNQLANFYTKYGIDEALFKKTYHSFIVNTKVARAKDMVDRYGVTGVPAIVVEGKYLITGSMAKSYQNMLKIMNYLLAKERKTK